ncbi:hypothetical protein DPEC_G00025920 [Dallia pectoralis]|uniref:Uncharacterized protein n=1 Tax=Dallia pectoralis TaxID=75939 RepID=A0ACC2HHD4_DALPE|nr:hypothetical protein DPEC_G00025920 [Dallia pectoralis]
MVTTRGETRCSVHYSNPEDTGPLLQSPVAVCITPLQKIQVQSPVAVCITPLQKIQVHCSRVQLQCALRHSRRYRSRVQLQCALLHSRRYRSTAPESRCSVHYTTPENTGPLLQSPGAVCITPLQKIQVHCSRVQVQCALHHSRRYRSTAPESRCSVHYTTPEDTGPLLQSPVAVCVTPLQTKLSIVHVDVGLATSCLAMETHFLIHPTHSSCANVVSRGSMELCGERHNR